MIYPVCRSEPLLVRQGSLHHVHRSPTHLKVQLRRLKGTVRVISNDATCKEGNARFTTTTLKALTDNRRQITLCVCF